MVEPLNGWMDKWGAVLWEGGAGRWTSHVTHPSRLGLVVLVRSRLLQLHHHSFHGDLLLRFALVAGVHVVIVLVVGGLVAVRRGRAAHGTEGVGAGGGQGAQQRRAL